MTPDSRLRPAQVRLVVVRPAAVRAPENQKLHLVIGPVQLHAQGRKEFRPALNFIHLSCHSEQATADHQSN